MMLQLFYTLLATRGVKDKNERHKHCFPFYIFLLHNKQQQQANFPSFHSFSSTYRMAHSKKYRRYVPEAGGSSSSIGGNNNGAAIMHRNSHKATISSSQLSVAVAELEPGSNGRLEITCLATIPAHVGPGEQFADYKTYSVKSKYI